MKKELIEILCRKSFKYSQEPIFKLVSGQMSRFYINCKLTTLNPRGMYLAGQLIFDTIKDLKVDGIGGLTFGADPIAIATAFVSELKKSPINAFSVRKNQKDHGVIKWIEGDIKSGQRVVIIDDVVTTGGSTINAIERVRSEAVQIVKVVVLVDRQEGGLENIRQYVKDVTAIVTKDELIEQFEKDKQKTDVLF